MDRALDADVTLRESRKDIATTFKSFYVYYHAASG